MQIVDRIVNRFFAREVGKDELGNRYFHSSFRDYLGREKRFVSYKGLAEPTKIPSNWHSWIHFLTNEIPTYENNEYIWQHSRTPNLTGTKNATTSKKWIKKDNYIKWQPK